MDASRHGWGAGWDHRHISGQWEPHCLDHINAQELWAVLNALRQWAPLLHDQVVSMQSDNHSAVAYVLWEGDTHSPRLMSLTDELLFFVDHWDMELCPCYLPRVVNIEADVLSHSEQSVKWHICPDIAQARFFQWGPQEINLFMDQNNAVLLTFLSVNHSDHRVKAVALHQALSFLWGYALPPPHLILQTLAKLATGCDPHDHPVVAQRDLAGRSDHTVSPSPDQSPDPNPLTAVDPGPGQVEVCGVDFMLKCLCTTGLPRHVAHFLTFCIQVKSSQRGLCVMQT